MLNQTDADKRDPTCFGGFRIHPPEILVAEVRSSPTGPEALDANRDGDADAEG